MSRATWSVVLIFALACVCALALPAHAQDKPQAAPAAAAQAAEPPAAKPADVASPDAILAACYDVISGPAGPRDWDRFNSLFAPGARLIPIGPRKDKPGINILSTLPSAGVGAILALILTRNDLTVVALIGIILLIGIVKKNAIMMIDFALEAERDQGKPPEEAIYQACLLRFRPIMMTTMAALLGGLPLALISGTGAELRRPLGITIVGGLLLSQLLTLYTTPVVYLWFDRLAQRFAKYRVGNTIPREAAPGDASAD